MRPEHLSAFYLKGSHTGADNSLNPSQYLKLKNISKQIWSLPNKENAINSVVIKILGYKQKTLLLSIVDCYFQSLEKIWL